MLDFDFEGRQVEINHHKFDDLSVTWNTIDPRAPVRWPGFDLQWRSEPLPGLHAVRGQSLKGVELLEWTGRDLARLTSSDAIGADRFQAFDRNRKVCSQAPAPGEHPVDTTVYFATVKLSESC
ncbi:hypothetical protein MUK60_29785 [Streptomyces sp. LRE541]|uniref:hypothetical protein n=1 Tax=Streptomyces sp. LRE541 TaxID=2931983 RepID=UPI00200F8462|nr:hypothetical protein [Streptomyces sp. LRE541]UPZ34387.1 hypothetical protein MUK60_29785 [Streptomyces sp. LRE541]